MLRFVSTGPPSANGIELGKVRVSCDAVAATTHHGVFLVGRRRHLAAAAARRRLGRQAGRSMLETCWAARTPGDVGGPVFAARRAAVSSRSSSRPVALFRARGGATPGIFTVCASWRWCAGGGGGGSPTTSI